MRYLKVLLLALFIFFAVLFFIQNQAPLSQQMSLTLNLFFIPPFESIPLPFYFVVVGAFVIGCLLSALWLLWEKFNASARLMKRKWKIAALEKELAQTRKELEAARAATNAEQGAKALPAASADPETAE